MFGCYMVGATWDCCHLCAFCVHHQTMQKKTKKKKMMKKKTMMKKKNKMMMTTTTTSKTKQKKTTATRRGRRRRMDAWHTAPHQALGVPPMTRERLPILQPLYWAVNWQMPLRLINEMSLTSRIGRTPEALSFVYRSLKKCMWIAIDFVTDLFIF